MPIFLPGRPSRSPLLPWLVLLAVSFGGCRSADVVDWSSQSFSMLQAAGTESSREQAWREWGDRNLRSGDILFVRGDSRILMGLVDFSQLCTDIAHSRFSHVAIVSREDGDVFVYDTVLSGPRRVRFADFVCDRRVWTMAVKRLRPEQQPYVEGAVAHCQRVFHAQTAFDKNFRLDNDALYCSEFVEVAFRDAGLPLSEPIRIDHLPGYRSVAASTVGLITAATDVALDQPVFVPGNARIGIWSSPHLELVLDVTESSRPPQQ